MANKFELLLLVMKASTVMKIFNFFKNLVTPSGVQLSGSTLQSITGSLKSCSDSGRNQGDRLTADAARQ